jgi:predicted dehydrogenase
MKKIEGTIGFGIVGVGAIAHTHAQAIKALAASHDVRLVGVLARQLEKAEAFARTHDIPLATGQPDGFFAHPDIQVVCITTPSGAHLEPSLRAIAAGNHLVVEKPLEITLARVDTLLDAADKAGAHVEGIFQARFTEGARTLKDAVAAGRFGRLCLCSAYVKWHRSAEYYGGWKGTLAIDGGGAVMNQSIHAIDLLQWIAGMPAEVFAWKARRVHLGIEAEDTACASLKFADGALGAFEATTAAYPGWERRIEICGEYGSAAIEDEKIVRWDFRDARPEDDGIRVRMAQSGAGSGSGASPAIGSEGHRRQLAGMIDALRGNAPCQIGGREARKAVALVRAIYESAESGAPIRLAP